MVSQDIEKVTHQECKLSYFTTPNGCRLFYTTHGVDSSKPVIIFLNGFTQTTLYWGNHVPAFSKHYGLLFYDARGQGQSGLGSAPISLKQHVSDLKNLLAHLTVEKAGLVGISHGARLALEFTLEFPDKVDRLVLCSVSGQTSDRCRSIVRSWLEILKISDLRAMAWAALPSVFGNKFLKDHEKILDKIINAVVIRNRKEALMAQLEGVLNYPPPLRTPAEFNVPALVISGSEDPLIETEDVRRMVHRLHAEHKQLDRIGHSIPAEAPQVFQKLVLEFFDSGE
jgi:pimeloyl-ACP methyl ester carboxylesterase